MEIEMILQNVRLTATSRALINIEKALNEMPAC